MGSYVSGRKSNRPVAEDCLALDLAKLMRLGPIGEGVLARGEYVWSIEGVRIAAVQFRLDLRSSEAATLDLDFHGETRERGGQEISQTIFLCHTQPNFGGRRWWMRCPVTGERARVLYRVPSGIEFAGRSALNLGYRVERLGHFDRPFEKLFRLHRKFGALECLGSIPEKPKGMWKRTWARHIAQLEKHNLACAEQITDLIGPEK